MQDTHDGQSAGKRDDTDLAWLAGLFDGEGCFGLHHKHNNRRKASIGPEITLCNTDGRLLQRSHFIMKQHGLGHYIHCYQGRNNQNPHWVIKIYGMKRCKVLLETLLPYLVGKADQALTMLEFINYRFSVPYGTEHGPIEEGLWQQAKKQKQVPNLRDYMPNSPSGDEDIVQSLGKPGE